MEQTGDFNKEFDQEEFPYQQSSFDRIEDVLEREHHHIEKKLSKLISGEGLSTNDRRNLFNEIKQDILHHMVAEERTYYGRIETLDQVEGLQIRESQQEHHQIKIIMSELDDVAVDDLDWTAKLRVLCEDLKHHHREEEEQFLARTKEAWSDQKSEEISEEFLKAKKQATL